MAEILSELPEGAPRTQTLGPMTCEGCADLDDAAERAALRVKANDR